MLQYRSFQEIVDHPGLRIVLVKGMPSPWGQAAKTIFEIKKLDYLAAPWSAGEPNEAIVKWGGEASAPIVAWAGEKPINRWIDILYLALAERLAPTPSMLPKDGTQRALMIGLAHEICGEMGIGWNRRLQLFAPAVSSGNAGFTSMARKYGFNEADVKAAGERTANSLRALTAQLKSQYARGVHYFVGEALSALDIYWTAFSNLLDPLPMEQCPMPEARRAGFSVSDPTVKAALDPLLLEHRGRIFRECFRDPMEL